MTNLCVLFGFISAPHQISSSISKDNMREMIYQRKVFTYAHPSNNNFGGSEMTAEY